MQDGRGGRKGMGEEPRQGGGSEAERAKEEGEEGGNEEGRRKGSRPQKIDHANSKDYFAPQTRMRHFRFLNVK